MKNIFENIWGKTINQSIYVNCFYDEISSHFADFQMNSQVQKQIFADCFDTIISTT